MTLKQCDAIRSDGQRCKRTASHGNYCHSHRHYGEMEPPKLEPLPEGKITKIDPAVWGFCEFCHDAYPLIELRPDKDKHLACKICYFRADVFNATGPQAGPKRYVAALQAQELANNNGVSYDAAVVELLEWGFKPERHGGYLFYSRLGGAGA